MNQRDGIYLSVRGIADRGGRVRVPSVEKLMAFMALVACAVAGVGIAVGRDPSAITVGIMLCAAVVAGFAYMRSS